MGGGKKVLVTGATGFTGSFVVRRLYEAGHEVFCFVRKSSNTSVLEGCTEGFLRGDLNNQRELSTALKGMDILVNVASIGFGHGPSIVRACLEAGVKRSLFFSTTAIFTTLDAKSKSIRLEAERAIRDSGLDYTIFRPTMIYGTSRDRNMIKLIRFVDRYPVVPVFGRGMSLQQPVYVKDLASAVAKAIDSPVTYYKEYSLSGREPVTYNEVVDTVAGLLGKKIVKIHFPVSISVGLIRVAGHMTGMPKFTREQVLRLNEDKDFSHLEASRDFNYSPVSFIEGIAEEIKEYRSLSKTGGNK